MEKLKLPISKEEAWRLYNQQKSILMISSWRDKGEVLKDGVSYEEFKSTSYYAIPLSEEESIPFYKLYKKFAWTIFGAAGTCPLGMILLSLSFLSHSNNLDNNYMWYRIIGIGLLSITTFSLFHMWKQAKDETKLWHSIFEKYNVSDWKNTWR